MSFEKAQQLLELATFVAARRLGVTLDDVGERLAEIEQHGNRWMTVHPQWSQPGLSAASAIQPPIPTPDLITPLPLDTILLNVHR